MNSQEMTETLQGWQQRAKDQARNLGRVTDSYLRDNTWIAVAVAAALGCVLGFLLTRQED